MEDMGGERKERRQKCVKKGKGGEVKCVYDEHTSLQERGSKEVLCMYMYIEKEWEGSGNEDEEGILE